MSEHEFLPRSPLLMSRDDTALLVVDMQQRLLPAISESQRIIWNVRRLVDGAKLLGVPVVATEQYPKGLGATVPELAERLGPMPSKLRFSCGGCPELFEDLRARNYRKILVCGIESHVCVAQTVFDLLSDGWQVYLAVDAIGSRFASDKQVAVQRMDSAGATVTTAEAALFEWCETASAAEFKQISQLARESAPSEV